MLRALMGIVNSRESNETESFWLMPFLGAFHAQLFGADGKATDRVTARAGRLGIHADRTPA